MARQTWIASVAVFAAASLCSCPSGLDGAADGAQNLPPNQNIGQGFEPGVALSSALGNDLSACGGVIPGATGQPDLEVMFFAFTTDTPANDADGSGAPLVRETPPPVDNNGTSDVFVAAVIQSSNPGSSTPNAFSQALAPVYRHPRCVTCHSFHYAGGFGSGGQHTGGDSTATNAGCGSGSCHDTDIGTFNGNAIDWRSPLVSQGDFDFRNKSTRELYDMTRAFGDDAEVVDHLLTDDKIFWGLDLGLDPFSGNLGDVPITKAQWDALVLSWEAGGFLFDTSGAVQDITLVSREAFNGVPGFAGNGSSIAPNAVYVPDAAYNPNSTAAQIAGRLHIVYATMATDVDPVFGDFNARRDIVRTLVEVRMNEEPTSGLPEVGRLNLLVRETQNVRISMAANGIAEANGDSEKPVISADATWVAYESLATNLVSGFVDGNGPLEPDVFAFRASGPVRRLVSRTSSSASVGGNGPSRNAHISKSGEVVAYESTADDLVAAVVGNGEQNIVYALGLDQAPQTVVNHYASVDSNGVLASGGTCSQPSVAFVGGSARIAFTSDKNNLVTGSIGAPNTQIYLHRHLGATDIVSRRGGAAGNGDSLRPTFALDGSELVFESAARNLDTVRPVDSNGVSDVLRFDVTRFELDGTRVLERISIAADGSDADGASSAPLIGTFVRSPLTFDGGNFASFRTSATNVGAAENTDAVLVFLE